jgi:hypothetical protein
MLNLILNLAKTRYEKNKNNYHASNRENTASLYGLES